MACPCVSNGGERYGHHDSARQQEIAVRLAAAELFSAVGTAGSQNGSGAVPLRTREVRVSHRTRSSAATRAIACGLIALTVSGCSSWQATRVAPPAPGAQPTSWGELHLRKSSGETVTLHAWTLEGDTLRGINKGGPYYDPNKRNETLALSDVALQTGNLEGDTLRKVLESTPVLPVDIRVHLVDGATVALKHARVDGDSLRGLMPLANGGHASSRPVAIALTDVWAIETQQFNAAKTAGLVVGTAAVILGILVLIAIESGALSD